MTGDWPEANPNTEARAPCPGGQRGEVSYISIVYLYLYLRYICTPYLYLQVVWDCGPWGARLTARPDHSACSGLEAAGYSVEEQLQRLTGGEEMPEQVPAYIMQ